MLNMELLQNCYQAYQLNLEIYNTMYEYYKGNTDAMKNYKMVTQRSNSKTGVNYIKKFIKEEVSYSVGNDINYISKDGSEQVVNDIDYYLDHWDENHDSELAKNMLIYSTAYELYYIDQNAEFSARIISPRNGYLFQDTFGNKIYFLNVFTKQFEPNTTYIDVYDDTFVHHFDVDFNKVAPSKPHGFNGIPVGLAMVSEEGKDDTLFKDIKGLQDAYETNLSDISNEISDFRNAYLCFTGASVDPKKIPEMKQLGVLELKGEKSDAKWLIKNINDGFIQSTLKTIEDKMYELSSHINHNEKLQSNTSSLALRSRLIALEEKCKLNQKALSNCIRSRIIFLFQYLKIIKNIDYDFRNIKIKFTPNIPQDDLMIAQIINQLGDKLSTETSLSLLSFIENPKNELNKLEKENQNIDIGMKLLEEDTSDEQSL